VADKPEYRGMINPARILLADDDDTFLHSTAEILRREGYEVACAHNAPEAIVALKSSQFDLLIADINMPGNPRLELIDGLPDLAPDMPVILITGHPSLESAVHSVRLPVLAYLLKPAPVEELLQWVRQGVRKAHLLYALRLLRQRLAGWQQELESMEVLITDPSSRSSGIPVEEFLALTLNSVANSLLDIKHLTESIIRHEPVDAVCHLVHCPRLDVFKGAIGETVKVLEKTKGAFKSKELGDLRRKLETMV
jgi:DNA-binding response OmpR family regulator